MDKYTIILLIVFCSKDLLCSGDGINETDIQTYPYQAQLNLFDGFGYYRCGGAIISENYVVTAAHCFVGIESISVRIATTFYDEEGLVYEASSFNSHPLYESTTNDYDVGVVQISEGMTLDGINARAIKLVSMGSDVSDGETVIVTGWGATNGGVQISPILMVAVLVADRTRCNELLDPTSRMFCAGLPEDGQNICQGDSGGPAVTENNGRLAGVTSISFGCTYSNSPGVYTQLGDLVIRSYLLTMTGV